MQPENWYGLLLARMDELEALVGLLRDEVYELRDEAAETWIGGTESEFSDGCIGDIAAALDKDDPDGWIGGTDGPDD